jgi:hypothetical protein
VLAVLLALLLAAPAHAAGPHARHFTVAPASVAPGGEVTFAFRATRGARVRVDLLRPGQPAVRARLGYVGASGRVSQPWTAALEGGEYTARLVVSRRGRRLYRRKPLTVTAPATLSTTTAPLFPVQGPYVFGGEAGRFGAGRTGHTHQGQDIAAAEGTPVVAPVAGTVYWTAYQAAGAGYYVVVAGDDGRHYVFMHLQEGSTAVAKGARVLAGQRIGAVGETGAADGPHLHFEIWVNGWWASKASTPIDPLPELTSWAASPA